MEVPRPVLCGGPAVQTTGSRSSLYHIAKLAQCTGSKLASRCEVYVVHQQFIHSMGEKGGKGGVGWDLLHPTLIP